VHIKLTEKNFYRDGNFLKDEMQQMKKVHSNDSIVLQFFSFDKKQIAKDYFFSNHSGMLRKKKTFL